MTEKRCGYEQEEVVMNRRIDSMVTKARFFGNFDLYPLKLLKNEQGVTLQYIFVDGQQWPKLQSAV